MSSRLLMAVTALLVLSAPALASDDAATRRGQLLFMQCRACHDTQPSSMQKVGPNLSGLFGRAAGADPDYKAYSDALKQSGVVWNDETLDKWLERPASLIPGTTMVFAGIQSQADRAALISYLKKATAVAAGEEK